MKKIIFYINIFLLFAFLFNACTVEQQVNLNINQVLDSLEYKLEWIDYRISLERWDHYTKGSADSLQFYQDLYSQVAENETIAATLEHKGKILTDEVDIRRWEILNNEINSGAVENDSKLALLSDSLSKIEVNYRASFNGVKTPINELYKLYRTNNSRQVREQAYRAYVSAGEELADGLARLIRLRDQRAKRAGYSNYFSLSFKEQGLDLSEYQKLLDDLDTKSRSAYIVILEKIKRKLNYNELQIWDIGYAYSGLNNQIDRYFPVDSQLYKIKEGLKGINIHIDRMPIYFDLDSRDGKSQFAFAFPIKPPYDMRVMANLIEGQYSTRTLLHEIGHALHFGLINQENHLFRSRLSGILSEAVAQIFAGISERTEWLEKYGGVPTELAEKFIEAKQENDVIYLRGQLMRLQFELQAYTNPNRDLNKLYWDLFEQYMMLPRHEDIKSWAALFYYITHPVYMQNYLYADMVAAQTFAYLERNYEKIVDNQMTKAFLVQNYLRFGSRYKWEELLERGTEEKLNPDYYLKSLGI